MYNKYNQSVVLCDGDSAAHLQIELREYQRAGYFAGQPLLMLFVGLRDHSDLELWIPSALRCLLKPGWREDADLRFLHL